MSRKRQRVACPLVGHAQDERVVAGREVAVLLSDEPQPMSTGRTYDVLLDGEKVGQVYKSTRTAERRPYPQAPYVTARWQAPCWRAELTNLRRVGDAYHDWYDSRAGAAWATAAAHVKSNPEPEEGSTR